MRSNKIIIAETIKDVKKERKREKRRQATPSYRKHEKQEFMEDHEDIEYSRSSEFHQTFETLPFSKTDIIKEKEALLKRYGIDISESSYEAEEVIHKPDDSKIRDHKYSSSEHDEDYEYKSSSSSPKIISSPSKEIHSDEMLQSEQISDIIIPDGEVDIPIKDKDIEDSNVSPISSPRSSIDASKRYPLVNIESLEEEDKNDYIFELKQIFAEYEHQKHPLKHLSPCSSFYFMADHGGILNSSLDIIPKKHSKGNRKRTKKGRNQGSRDKILSYFDPSKLDKILSHLSCPPTILDIVSSPISMSKAPIILYLDLVLKVILLNDSVFASSYSRYLAKYRPHQYSLKTALEEARFEPVETELVTLSASTDKTKRLERIYSPYACFKLKKKLPHEVTEASKEPPKPSCILPPLSPLCWVGFACLEHSTSFLLSLSIPSPLYSLFTPSLISSLNYVNIILLHIALTHCIVTHAHRNILVGARACKFSSKRIKKTVAMSSAMCSAISALQEAMCGNIKESTDSMLYKTLSRSIDRENEVLMKENLNRWFLNISNNACFLGSADLDIRICILNLCAVIVTFGMIVGDYVDFCIEADKISDLYSSAEEARKREKEFSQISARVAELVREFMEVMRAFINICHRKELTRHVAKLFAVMSDLSDWYAGLEK
ncbi:hypothetical protein ADUPG1_012998 [Aduncisulcus paluster]|uniref:Gamma tubulin complex component C-terminal domain-containing protein n=1 Tax=Aduncisulcus paluster TaxID=2918883 RepID=A0ABQ5K364_9EUKA|nr:hypothetical protein ADUPG1_012998 [Aduncisulcus paluster]